MKFCATWQAYSKICVQMLKSKNNQDNFEEAEQS